MEKKWKWFIGFAVLVILISGAYALYQTLGSEFDRGGLVVATTASQTVSSTTVASMDSSEEISTTQETSSVEIPKYAAPDFTVLDNHGNRIRLSDLRGKPVIVNFWASWCPPCKAEMPDFEKAFSQYGEEISFMMVNMTDGSRETLSSAKAYIANVGYTFPVYFDTEYEAAYAYQVYSLPATYFIDAQGYLVAYYPGMLTADILAQGIGMLID